MRKIKLYIAASIDGYIAYPDGGLDWLSEYPITPEFDYGYNSFYESIDSVIMGGKSYRDILNMDVIYPYKDKTSYIITRNTNNQSSIKNVQFLSENIIEIIHSLKEQQGKDIWLVGGGEIISMLLENDLVDEMLITYIPKILGDGVPLFPKMQIESKWQLLNSKPYGNGVLSIEYQRISQ